jgi:hypothetical protein
MPRRNRIVSSSDGVNAEGRLVITPLSVLTCVNDADGREFQTMPADNVRVNVDTVWSKSFKGVMLPIQRIFDHVPISPALIRHWLRSNASELGGLCFPVPGLDMESNVMKVQIRKHAPVRASTDPLSVLQVDINVLILRRDTSPSIDLSPSVDLQPFDDAIWDSEAYESWCCLYVGFAPIVEEEMRLSGGPGSGLPSDGCALFRRMMRAHFNDFGLLFGRVWLDFGLRNFTEDSMHEFMRNTLLHMFLEYHATGPAPPPRPPSCNAVSVDPGQRMCAKCLTCMLGHGQMKRCGRCNQVGEFYFRFFDLRTNAPHRAAGLLLFQGVSDVRLGCPPRGV